MASKSASPFQPDPGPQLLPPGPAATKPFTPKVGGHERRTPPPQIDRRPPMYQMVLPERWGLDGGKLRPIPGTAKLVPGMSGVEAMRGGGVRVGTMLTHYRERGWIPIPLDTLPPSQAHRGSYLCEVEGVEDTVVCYWQQVFPGSREFRRNDELYYEWLDYVVSSGVVPPCQDYVVARLLEEKTAEHRKAVDRARSHPSWGPIAEDLAAEVQLLRAEMKKRMRPAPQGKPVIIEEPSA